MLRITLEPPVQPVLDHKASMRPQRNAADNRLIWYSTRLVKLASMRPQRNAADNLRLSPKELREIHNASMRPQRNAADNASTALPVACSRRCFNEAAAECCG